MIICQCNVLTRKALEAAIDRLLDEDPYRLIVPGMVYRMAGCSSRCGGCHPHLAAIIERKIAVRRPLARPRAQHERQE